MNLHLTDPPVSITAVLEKRAAARQEELCACYERIDELESALCECRQYFEAQSDVIDGDHGSPRPNVEMRMLQHIDEVL